MTFRYTALAVAAVLLAGGAATAAPISKGQLDYHKIEREKIASLLVGHHVSLDATTTHLTIDHLQALTASMGVSRPVDLGYNNDHGSEAVILDNKSDVQLSIDLYDHVQRSYLFECSIASHQTASDTAGFTVNWTSATTTDHANDLHGQASSQTLNGDLKLFFVFTKPAAGPDPHIVDYLVFTPVDTRQFSLFGCDITELH